MNIIVVGCGRFGAALAYRLYKSGNNVTIIDRNPDAFDNLPPDFLGLMIEGDALSQDVLLRAGIEKADSLALATNSDAINVVVAHIAREAFHVPNIVVRNYDPKYRALFEEFELQVVSSVSWGVQRMEEILLDSGLRVAFSLGNGEVKIYEVITPAHWQGKKIRELFSGGECTLIALTRAGQARLPDQDAVLEEGDVLHISATLKGIECLQAKLFRPGEGGARH